MEERPPSVDAADVVFGKYRIIAALGAGGMAEVFLAVARGPVGFNKLQVVKRLRRPMQQDADFVAMFLDEARLAARLNHPHIVQTNEVGQQEGTYFLAMEYLEGQSLNRFIRQYRSMTEAPLPLGLQLHVLVEVLSGLEYAHTLTKFDGSPLGFVHRDVSPHNIMVTYEGVSKLLDFGIAKAATNANHTRVGVMKGKIPYMAPEQAAGDRVTLRADLFPVGVMLWEAIAGRRMWKGVEEFRILRGVLRGEIPKIGDVKPDAPEELRRICERALQIEPEDRYQSAAEFQADLEAFIESAGIRVTGREIGKNLDALFKDERTKIKSSIDLQLAELTANPDGEARLKPISFAPPPTSGTPSFSLGDPRAMRVSGTPVSGPSLQGLASSAPGTTLPTGPMPLFMPPLSLEPPAKKWPLVLGAAGGALILLVGVIVLVRSLASSPGPAAPTPPVAAASSSTKGQDDANVVKLIVRASPTEARLFFDDAPLDGNPFRGKFPKDGAKHRLRAEAAGYNSEVRLVTLDGDVELELALGADASVPTATTSAKKPTVAPARPASTQNDDVPTLSGKKTPKVGPKLDVIE